MKALTLLAAVLITLFTSCEDVIDLDMPQGKKTLVVEGWLTNKSEPNFIKLYFTNTITAQSSLDMVGNAKIILSDNVGNTELLQEVTTGKYQIKTLKSIEGRTYTLKIESAAGNYEAKTEVKRLSMPIDSLTFKFEKKSALYEKEGFYPRSHGQELEGKGDFIQVRLYKNGVYLNRDADFNLFSDEFVDGNYIANNLLSVKEPLVKDDLLKAETWSVTEDALLFWLDIQIQLQNGQLFATPLANTRTNIKKTSSNATDVIGYFGASLIHSVESRVK